MTKGCAAALHRRPQILGVLQHLLQEVEEQVATGAENLAMITMTMMRMKMTVGADAGARRRRMTADADAGANPKRMTADAGGQGSLRGDAGQRRMTADADAGPNPKGVGAAGPNPRAAAGAAGARRRMTAGAAGAAGVGGESGRLSRTSYMHASSDRDPTGSNLHGLLPV